MRCARDAGRQRPPHLAFRDDIGASAEPGEQPQHRLVGIGLDRVADARRLGGEGSGKSLVLPSKRGGRIDVARRAGRGRDARERHLFGAKRAAAIGKRFPVAHWAGYDRG